MVRIAPGREIDSRGVPGTYDAAVTVLRGEGARTAQLGGLLDSALALAVAGLLVAEYVSDDTLTRVQVVAGFVVSVVVGVLVMARRRVPWLLPLTVTLMVALSETEYLIRVMARGVDNPFRWCDNLANNDPVVMTFMSRTFDNMVVRMAYDNQFTGQNTARMARARADMSSSPWPPATRPVSSWAARALTGRAAPSCPARSSAMPRSLRWSATLNPSG